MQAAGLGRICGSERGGPSDALIVKIVDSTSWGGYATIAGLALWGMLLATVVQAKEPVAADEAAAFGSEFSRRHGVPQAEVARVLTAARVEPRILELVSKPAETKPWHEYRRIFLTPSRIEAGVRYWREHLDVLEAAQDRYGVPAEIIVAIIGVETHYGRFTGTFRVVDALVTLAFSYPPRGRFFRSELEEYLLLVREEGLDPLVPKGSYAGAMGMPQFISSSYRRYAVDFDEDGQRDLWHSPPDIVGSVANYFGRHGWQSNQPVISPARVIGADYHSVVSDGLQLDRALGQLRRQGVEIDEPWPDEEPAVLIELDGDAGPEHWVGLQNFYVITRYNHSKLYAMAVYQLSQAIAAQRAEGARRELAQRQP